MSGKARNRPEHGLPDAFQLTEQRRDFGVVLVAIVAAMIFQLATPDTDLSRFLAIVLQGTVIVLALRAAGFHRHIVHLTALVLIGLSIVVGVALIGIQDVAPAAPRILTLVLVLLTPAAIVAGVVRELREDRRVTVQTVYCGISLYLLLGLAFAVLFGAVQDIDDSSFFAHGITGTSNDFLYFSLATLTTVGYGDLTAASDLGRAMSVTEALIGQIYLVTVVAVTVSNVRRRT
ncbi:MAG: potassium channel family protein [Solirubrobacterales bacterium]|nr:two pore domain potassium channel family protein [Solirubrobacterales bacterium]